MEDLSGIMDLVREYELIPIQKAAKRLGVGARYMRQWVATGNLTTVEIPGTDCLLVSMADALRILGGGLVRAGEGAPQAPTPAEPADPDTALRDFVALQTRPGDTRVVFREIYGDYREFCAAQGEEPLTPRKFGAAMNAMGYTTYKCGGETYKRGLRLLTAEDIDRMASDRGPATRTG